MKKIITWVLLFLVTLGFGLTTYASTPPTNLVIHYYRYDDNYANFNFWLWPNAPKDGGGVQFDFPIENKDEHGVFYEVNLTESFASYPETTRVGIIIKQGGWDGYREVGGDRFIDLTDIEVIDGKAHAYFVEGDLRIGTSTADLENHIPDYRAKILRSYFDVNGEIITVVSEIPEAFQIFESDVEIYNGIPETRSFSIEVDNLDIQKTYKVVATYPDNRVLEKVVSLENLYDTPMFEQAYTYEGTLGVSFENNQTVFRLWAPLSEKITLNLYEQGHPDYNALGEANEEDTPYETHELTAIENGAWEIKIDGNLHGKYYTFSVTNDGTTYEVTDPYAYSTGANGLRGMIVDFNLVNPENWTYDDRPNTIENLTDYIVYELHVRDLTTHSSWNGNESYRGRFMGLTEKGTTYSKNGVTVTTGLDHIVELGVNAVQLLPIFDFGYVDEVEAYQNPNYTKIFNWGYMPYHFNTLEGSYATNPFDGTVRINEFKQVIQALHNEDIRVIMDVVYNHTGESQTSNFHKIVPGYYHRLTNDGGFSNGSGTGNETASERSMMQKFMVDSVLFLAQEYNLSGFRFDLMALHDVETMNLIKEKLNEIDPTIVVYGEPWMGGTSPISSSISANQQNLDELVHVGAFNDHTRDAVKGSVWTASEGGFVQGKVNAGIIQKVKYGIVGGISYPGITEVTTFAETPDQTINYVSAHDNNTLYDKLKLTGVSNTYIKEMQVQANAIVLTAQGIPFIHAGAEMMRSKPLASGGFDHNSYESPDDVNQLRWDRKADYLSVFEYYKALIQIRKTYEHFRMTDANEINSRLSFLETDSGDQAIAFKIAGENGSPDMIVIHSANPKSGLTLVDLDPGKFYRILTTADGPTLENSEIVSGIAFALSHTTTILVEQQLAVSFNQKVVTIPAKKSYDVNSNFTTLIEDAVIEYQSLMNTKVPARYTITVKTTKDGKASIDFFTVLVEGRRYNVNLVDKTGGR
ncbi:MAG: type I pullulanase [Acholeplasmataceae bacterium]|nr:type I pullulanase [Acholeplasmataceae bacterium]